MEAGFSVKYPLLNIVSPINTLVNSKIKLRVGKLGKLNNLVNLLVGTDPIVMVARKLR